MPLEMSLGWISRLVSEALGCMDFSSGSRGSLGWMGFSNGSLGPWAGWISRRAPWGLGLDGFVEGFPGALSWTSESLSLDGYGDFS